MIKLSTHRRHYHPSNRKFHCIRDRSKVRFGKWETVVFKNKVTLKSRNGFAKR